MEAGVARGSMCGRGIQRQAKSDQLDCQTTTTSGGATSRVWSVSQLTQGC